MHTHIHMYIVELQKLLQYLVEWHPLQKTVPEGYARSLRNVGVCNFRTMTISVIYLPGC